MAGTQPAVLGAAALFAPDGPACIACSNRTMCEKFDGLPMPRKIPAASGCAQKSGRRLALRKASGLPSYHRENRMLRLSLDALQILDAIDRRGSFAGRGQGTAQGAFDDLLHGRQAGGGPRRPGLRATGPARRTDARRARSCSRKGATCSRRRRTWSSACAAWPRAGKRSSRWAWTRCSRRWACSTTSRDSTRRSPRKRACASNRMRCRARGKPCWSGRVDLLVGAAGEGPSGGGYISEPMGEVRVRVRGGARTSAGAHRPAADEARPAGTSRHRRRRHRAQADARAPSACCSARTRDHGARHADEAGVPVCGPRLRLPARTLHARCDRAPVASSRSRSKNPRLPETFHLAWRSSERGAALDWWRERLRGSMTLSRLLLANPDSLSGGELFFPTAT